jgi:hypothetical protein
MIPTTEDFRVALQTRMQEAQRKLQLAVRQMVVDPPQPDPPEGFSTSNGFGRFHFFSLTLRLSSAWRW